MHENPVYDSSSASSPGEWLWQNASSMNRSHERRDDWQDGTTELRSLRSTTVETPTVPPAVAPAVASAAAAERSRDRLPQRHQQQHVREQHSQQQHVRRQNTPMPSRGGPEPAVRGPPHHANGLREPNPPGFSSATSNESFKRSSSVRRAELSGNLEDCLKMKDYVLLLQDFYRSSRQRNKRLDSKNLRERVLHEAKVLSGSFRLLNVICIFAVLMLSSTLYSDSVTAKAIIRESLDAAFDFERIEGIKQRGELWDVLHKLQDDSQTFFPGGNHMYESELKSIQFVDEMEVFESEEMAFTEAKNIVQVDVQRFTFQAWVQITNDFLGGANLIRKRMQNHGTGQELSCWEWSLGRFAEQQFQYGAHSYFSRWENFGYQPLSVHSTAEEKKLSLQISVKSKLLTKDSDGRIPREMQMGRKYLLTVVVNNTVVTFYQNHEVVNVTHLNFPVSDCSSQNSIMLGGPGVAIGQLRFYPFALDNIEVMEVLEHGDILSNIASSSLPMQITRDAATQTSIRVVEDLGELGYHHDGINGLSETIAVMQSAPSPDADSADTSLVEEQSAFGKLNTGGAFTLDPVTGSNYSLALHTPLLFQPGNPSTDTAYYWDRDTFPSWAGHGMTLAFWYKHHPDDPYIFASHPNSVNGSEQCWGIWMYERGGGFRSRAPNPAKYIKYVSDNDSLPPLSVLEPGQWRHVTFQFDVVSDLMNIFIDGRLMMSEQFPTGMVAQLDSGCQGPEAVVAVGRSVPGWTFAAGISLGDVRVYVEDQPMAHRHIYTLANSEAVVRRSCASSIELVNDPTWFDIYGHDCKWYAAHAKEQIKNLCQTPGAQEHCRLHCANVHCFPGHTTSPTIRYLWPEITRFEPKTNKGSLCLSSKVDLETVVANCKARNFDKKYLDLQQENLNFGADLTLNLTDCDQIRDAVDPTCTFDGQIVEDFTKDVKANGGDFSIAFWVKVSNELSLDNNGHFLPHVGMFESLTPVQPSISLYAQHGKNTPNYTGPSGDDHHRLSMYSACGDAPFKQVRTYQYQDLDQNKWTMITVVWRNTSVPTFMEMGFDEEAYAEPGVVEGDNFPLCLQREDNPLIVALELSYGAIISPILLMPFAMSRSAQQRLFYSQKDDMELRPGPVLSSRQRSMRIYPVTKYDYKNSIAAASPPILFVDNYDGYAKCNLGFSANWLRNQHQRTVLTHCKPPFKCEDDVMNIAAAGLECGRLKGGQNGSFFGLSPSSFEGHQGYADLLYSFTRQHLLLRDGTVRETKDFLSSKTLYVMVVYVFYAPALGVTTVMQAEFDMSGDEHVSATVTVKHFQILAEDAFATYTLVMSMGVFWLMVMFVANVRGLLNMRFHFKKYGEIIKQKKRLAEALSLVALDGGVFLLTLLFVAWRIEFKSKSTDYTDETLGTISEIPWADTSVSSKDKTNLFLVGVIDLLRLMWRDQILNNICTVILFLLLFRALLATSCHPRLALLTGTISHSIDDLWHTAVLVILCLSFFASIGYWLFGDRREDFSSWWNAIHTLFEMWIGEFPDGWSQGGYLLSVYTIIYMLVNFVLVLNFILAIVVESYMKVREDCMLCEVEAEFFTDVFWSLVGFFKQQRYGWPAAEKIVRELEALPHKRNVDLKQLRSFRHFKFKSVSSAQAFLNHYYRYDFLEPKELEQPSQFASLVDDIETRVALMMGSAPSTKQDRRNFGLVSWRRRTRATAAFADNITSQSTKIDQVSSRMERIEGLLANMLPASAIKQAGINKAINNPLSMERVQQGERIPQSVEAILSRYLASG